MKGRKKTREQYKADKAYRHTDKMPYYLYVKSKEWDAKCKECCKSAGWKCEACGSSIDLQVHHYNYLTIMRESRRDLFCLCRSCHEAYHKKIKSLPQDFLSRDERLNEITNIVQQSYERK